MFIPNVFHKLNSMSLNVVVQGDTSSLNRGSRIKNDRKLSTLIAVKRYICNSVCQNCFTGFLSTVFICC